MENKYSEKRIADIGTLIVIGILIIGVLIYHYKKDSSVTEYKTETVGKITDFRHRKDFSYSLKYEYYVDGKSMKEVSEQDFLNAKMELKVVKVKKL